MQNPDKCHTTWLVFHTLAQKYFLSPEKQQVLNSLLNSILSGTFVENEEDELHARLFDIFGLKTEKEKAEWRELREWCRERAVEFVNVQKN